jgi:UDP-N-acetylglucosamine transferase subunit ALG13
MKHLNSLKQSSRGQALGRAEHLYNLVLARCRLGCVVTLSDSSVQIILLCSKHFTREHQQRCYNRFSEANVVESLAFVERVKNQLGVKAAHRDVVEPLDGMYCKAAEFDAGNFTGRKGTLSSKTLSLWNESADEARI